MLKRGYERTRTGHGKGRGLGGTIGHSQAKKQQLNALVLPLKNVSRNAAVQHNPPGQADSSVRKGLAARLDALAALNSNALDCSPNNGRPKRAPCTEERDVGPVDCRQSEGLPGGLSYARSRAASQLSRELA